MMHKSVLLQEVITGLDIKLDDVFFDGTVNGGGHSKAVAELLGAKGVIIGTDLDGDALAKAGERLKEATAKIILKQASFRDLDAVLAEIKVTAVDKMLLDLGLSSNQFEASGRGFSFQKDEPLLMTFKNHPGPSDLSAFKIVNTWEEGNIAQIIESYGEERFAKRIARAITLERRKRPIKTTMDLVAVIKRAIPKKGLYGRLNPATKTFQALRIAVNDEIGALKEGLQKGFECLNVGGRMAVISFHSLEDRIVKNYWKKLAAENRGRILTKKPVMASPEEILENPRSRSAKLRIIEKTVCE
ncbi:MAG: 16S rRNA (cytosine(1402)-N(4))-methyltransferase RsmH [Candidatus Taylorbacteria bacterium]|nr:16S rRNA (cytosine(1402)-N(4))-methyltransferase RsmH [Candidatus Taylorbacteria bacterium]